MTNPWTVNNPFDPTFGVNRYVLKGDGAFICRYNCAFRGDLNLELMPEPFIGDFCKSKLMILMSNPGSSLKVEKDDSGKVIQDSELDWHNEDAFLSLINNSWDHTKPFYYYGVNRQAMNAKLSNTNLDWHRNPGYKYWHEKMRQLMSSALSICPNDVFEAELFPYHSDKFTFINHFLDYVNNWDEFLLLPSTKYLRQLINCAMACDKVIIIARSKVLYFKLCKNLENYPHLYVLKSPQGAHFTVGNIVNYQLYKNKKSTPNDINIFRNDIQNMPKCSQDCCEKMLNVLSQSN